MNIILLDNQFEGAYGSIGVFIKEVFEELMLMGHRVFVAKTVEVAISIYEKNDVDFSIGIGKYGFVVDGKALYDRYNTMHYQWIIDNPYKIKIDYESSNITYVVIDGLFASCIEGVKNFVLELPLGVSSNICRENVKTRTEGIVFAGQIKNPNLIYHEISEHRLKRQITDVIEQQLNQLDEPYINLLNDKVKDIEMEDKKNVFRLSNSFLRAYKRKKVISEIDGYPVFLIGDNYDSEIEKKENVIRLGRMNYVKTFEAIQRFYYALNIEPNFNLGFHDRIIRSISNGCVAITNEGKRQRDIFGDNIILYKYSEIYRVLEKINATRINEVFEMNKQANEIVKNQFSWLVILNKIIKNYRKEL